MADQGRRVGQEGSRWYNEPPSGDQLAKWFKDNVPLADGLDAANYVAGITLIPSTEKAKEVVGWTGDGEPVIKKRENLVFTPYAKVETRVKYFHDLMDKEEEWIGIIEPVPPANPDDRLPPGFFSYFIPTTEGMGQRYICCTMKVTVFEKGSIAWKEIRNVQTGAMQRVRVGEVVLDAPPATKMIPTTTWGWGEKSGERRVVADDFAMMKAETGAIGRALGLAGMLVIPGTGVATAEDMSEVESGGGAAPAELPETDSPPLPSDKAPTSGEELGVLRQEAAEAINSLKNEFPSEFKLFQEWAQSRSIGKLDAVDDPTILRGLTSKATRDFRAAEEAKAEEEKE